jgi:hypothetical protein
MKITQIIFKASLHWMPIILVMGFCAGCADSCSSQPDQDEIGGESDEAGGESDEAGGESGEAGGESGEAGGESGEAGGESGEAGGESGEAGGGQSGGADAAANLRLGAYKALSGPIMISLIWDTIDDLDLSVTTPAGEVINWEEKISTCGGVLQIDANAQNTTKTPLEHIYWQAGKIKAGKYLIRVQRDNSKSNVNVDFKVLVQVDGKLSKFSGVFKPGETGAKAVHTLNLETNDLARLNK